MEQRSGVVTFQSNPLTLIGPALSVGQAAPDAVLLNNDLEPTALHSFQGKVCVISAVPSLDTPVCDLQTRRFNQEAASLGDDVVVVTVSVDLPFAQKRWCGAAGADRVITLSDHRDVAFGNAYGLLIQELRLLTRAVLVLDPQGTIRYLQIVPEMTEEPDYESALAAIRDLVG